MTVKLKRATGKILGIRGNEAFRLNDMKNALREQAFELRYYDRTISQEEADRLNKELSDIVNKLMEYGYDPVDDLLIDFDNFVETSKYYKQFSW